MGLKKRTKHKFADSQETVGGLPEQLEGVYLGHPLKRFFVHLFCKQTSKT